MGVISLWHWALLPVAVGVVWALPIFFSARLLTAKGYNWTWAWLGLVPWLGYIVLIAAFLLKSRNAAPRTG